MVTRAPAFAPVRVGGALGLLHPAGAEAETAVLLLPPFGWEEICSYRVRYAWAAHLAAAGRPVLRLDLPGTGDAPGGPGDAGLVPAWIAAAGEAAALLRERTGARRVLGLGLGLGGLLALAARGEGAPIDDLVLWAVPARGRTLVRELTAFARLEQGTEESEGLVAGGYRLSDETAETLRALEPLAGEGVGGRPPGRALLLGRDELAPEARLAEGLSAAGWEVETTPGPGYAAMMAEPDRSVVPAEAFALVDRWLGGPPAGDPTPAPPAPEEWTAASTRESWSRPAAAHGRTAGIVALPAEGPAAPVGLVLLNAGAIRRTGPNRMWTEAARRWAARGVASIRTDLEAIGDADGDASLLTEVRNLYRDDYVPQVRAAVDALQERAGVEQVLLAGLCSGAFWAFHTALADERVAAAVMLNSQLLYWAEMHTEERAANRIRAGLADPRDWARLLRGGYDARALARFARQAAEVAMHRARARLRDRSAPALPPASRAEEALAALDRRGVRLAFAFSGREPLQPELEALLAGGRYGSVSIDPLPGTIHTLRPPAAQREAHALLDREVAALIPAATGPRTTRSS